MMLCTDKQISNTATTRNVSKITTVETGMLGQPDEVQLAYAGEQGRIIVTHDSDFLRLSNQTTEHCGIVYCQKGTRSLGEVVRGLMLIHEVYTANEMNGQVEFL